ncbi:MAG: alkaline phosphatase D family protein [Verrucomicrobiaceae bacterium]|nr:alkaline phosphatase D family protein [Verrucomicrobiaceae bacterium]
MPSRRQFLLATSSATAAMAQPASDKSAADPVKKAKPAAEVLDPVPVIAPVPGPAYLHAGPMLGHVTGTTARLWAKGSNAGELAFKISKQADLSDARVVQAAALVETSSFTGQVEISGLEPATRYHYAPLIDGAVALSRPYPSFVTTPAADTQSRLRFAFGSCVGRRGMHAAAAFGEMAARRNFDLLLMLGDNHYGDSTDPAVLRDYYFMLRSVDGFAKLTRETPTYAIWDDHDYGPNNSDGGTAGKEDSLRVFKEWWANPAYGEEGNPGCYHRFSRNSVDFFMLDSRYHRTPNKTPEDGAKTMLGARRLQWLKQGLSESKAAFKIIACGSEWQTLTQADCWSSFARERQDIFDHITSNKIGGVILLSGDRHFTAGYQIQGRHLEFTSGPLGSGNGTLQENPERFTGADEGKLWMILDLDPAAPTPSCHYEIWQAGGGLLERRALSLDEINGAKKITRSPTPLLPERMESKVRPGKA